MPPAARSAGSEDVLSPSKLGRLARTLARLSVDLGRSDSPGRVLGNARRADGAARTAPASPVLRCYEVDRGGACEAPQRPGGRIEDRRAVRSPQDDEQRRRDGPVRPSAACGGSGRQRAPGTPQEAQEGRSAASGAGSPPDGARRRQDGSGRPGGQPSPERRRQPRRAAERLWGQEGPGRRQEGAWTAQEARKPPFAHRRLWSRPGRAWEALGARRTPRRAPVARAGPGGPEARHRAGAAGWPRDRPVTGTLTSSA